MATIANDSTTVSDTSGPGRMAHEGPRHHLQLDRTFITKPGEPAETVNEEERSMLITFIAFALIVAISLLAVMALLNENGSGSVTTFAEGMQTALTPNVQT